MWWNVAECRDFSFFSSRRRHTRYWRDWSSDVCSSDLRWLLVDRQPPWTDGRAPPRRLQIGRASCRERGEISVVAVSLKKKTRLENDDVRRQTLKLRLMTQVQRHNGQQ